MATLTRSKPRKSTRRRTPAEIAELRAESLSRAVGGFSMSNYGLIFDGFTAKGIPMEDIEPRVNVFTYNAWRALGRQVRKGEKGVKVYSWIPAGPGKGEDVGASRGDEKGEKSKRDGMWCVGATVFHISQTDPVE